MMTEIESAKHWSDKALTSLHTGCTRCVKNGEVQDNWIPYPPEQVYPCGDYALKKCYLAKTERSELLKYNRLKKGLPKYEEGSIGWLGEQALDLLGTLMKNAGIFK